MTKKSKLPTVQQPTMFEMEAVAQNVTVKKDIKNKTKTLSNQMPLGLNGIYKNFGKYINLVGKGGIKDFSNLDKYNEDET